MRRLFLILSLLLPLALLGSSAAFSANKLEASIFSYDGKDFVRTETTLMQGGQSAVGTKPWPKNTPTPGQRPFLVKTTKPTTHRSSVEMAN